MDNTKGLKRISQETPSVNRGKNYLLAIGINDYAHCPKLNNAVKDVSDFIALMTTKYQFEATNITTLFDAEATSRRIVHAFRDLVKKVGVDDNLIIYFSGHGEFDKVLQQGYWIPVDAEKGEFSDYLPNSTIIDVLNAIGSRHTLLIADSCFSGTLFSSRDVNRDISQRLEIEPSRWGLASGRNEIVSDGQPNSNSPFADKLLDLLRRNDKSLGAAELCAKMMEIVAANAQQTPRGEPLKIKGHDGGQFFFHAKARQNPEELLWQTVFVQNTEGGYVKYLRQNPKGKYAETAKQKLSELEVETDWKEAKNRNKASTYLKFIEKHPLSIYIEEANKRLDSIENQDFIQKGEEEKKERQRQAELAKQVEEKRQQEAAEAERKERQKQDELQRKKDEEAARQKRLAEEAEQKRQAEIASWMPDMVLVKGGTFQMGDTFGDGYINGKPVHAVTVSDFYIGKYQVTQAEWQKIMGNNPSHFKGDKLPVEQVSWHDCQAFCKKLSERTRRLFRLPTEAEWEYAARGGNVSKGYKYGGSNDIDEVAWCATNSDKKTHPTGTKKPNELDIFDMSGNVLEWCEDVWHSNYKGAPSDNKAWIKNGDERRRVQRGGAWNIYPGFNSTTYRSSYYPLFQNKDFGFRLALSLEQRRGLFGLPIGDLLKNFKIE